MAQFMRDQMIICLFPSTTIQRFYATFSHQVHWKGRDFGTLWWLDIPAARLYRLLCPEQNFQKVFLKEAAPVVTLTSLIRV